MTTKNPLTEVREHLIAALHADLVGPFLPPTEDGEEAEEVLRLPPSRWYLTGFLAPVRGRELEAAAGSDDEELPAGSDEDDEDAAAADPEPKRKNILPASMGLSVLLPPGSVDETVRATLSYAEYTAENENPPEPPFPKGGSEGGDSYRVWRRHAREPVTEELRLDPAEIAKGRRLDVPKDVWIVGRLGEVSAPGLAPRTRALSLFVVKECGYSASGLQERIYCAARDAEPPMAAILISTGSSGAEGTLGGLVDQGRRIGHHLKQAIDLGKLCSNDPVCADHSPRGYAERFLEGAACHGCLFVAECSCERFNRYLDRALVVPTMGHDRKLAFFG